jgi:putative tRNA adenosine deaminase-associated protein
LAALLARTEEGWDASDIDLEEVEDLPGIADLMREAAVDDEPVLLFLEQEESWFAVIRVESEDDPRVFVSDAAAASRSAYGDVLLTDEVIELPDEEGPLPAGPVGDDEILADLGVDAADLTALAGEVPADALGTLAENLGVGDELEAVR